MGKHSRKRRHVAVSSSSGSDASSSSPPVHKRRRHSRDATDVRLKKLIKETLLEMRGAKSPCGSHRPSGSDVSTDEEEEFPDVQTGKYVSKDILKEVLSHVKANMGFAEDEVPSTSSGPLLRQFQSASESSLPVHDHIWEVLRREWKDPDKIVLPRFMAKLYPLTDMQKTLPDAIQVDSLVSSLVGRTSLNEEAILKDAVDKKVDSSLKKVYAGMHLSMRAGIYATYVAQSLITDFKHLFSSLEEGEECSALLDSIERQVEFLSDVSFDVVRSSALAGGASVAARRNLLLRDWKTDSSQKAAAFRMPFEGSLLFGADLEEKIHKLFKEKKHSSSVKQVSAPVQQQKSFRQPSRRQRRQARGKQRPVGGKRPRSPVKKQS